MKPKLHRLPCGDWVPVELVTAIVVNPRVEAPEFVRNLHVLVVLNDGKVHLICPANSMHEAKQIADNLGKEVNAYRTAVLLAEAHA